MARVAQAEAHDPLLEVGADLVRHPRAPALADPQGLEPVAVEPALEAVVARAVHPHRPAGGRDVAELVGQGEQPQAESDEQVILCHATLLSVGVVTPSLSERADAPAAAGASDLNASSSTLWVSQILGVSPG
jgi:hypothetical protein